MPFGGGVWILHIDTFPVTQLKYFYALLVLNAWSFCSMYMLNFSLLSATGFLRCFSTWSSGWQHCQTVIKMKSLCILWKYMGEWRYRPTLNISTVWRWVLNFTALPFQLFSLYSLNRRLVGPQSQFWCVGEEKNLVLLCEIKSSL